jgi:lysophospholipid acyltransferase (LPLAT)-like uncharacterized protein
MASMKDRLLLGLAPWLAARIIPLLYRSLRPATIGDEAVKRLWAAGRPLILTFWHDQLLMMVKGYRGPGGRVLISPSRDGELIARTMRHFGVGAVRGSSSRGGFAAVREMISLSGEPFDLAFTPDGPKGPRHLAKPGVAQLARATSRPVVPMAFACSHGYRFRSWDRFLLPAPWGRAVYSFGEPLVCQPDETVAEFLARVQAAMDDNTSRAEEYLRQYDLPAV